MQLIAVAKGGKANSISVHELVCSMNVDLSKIVLNALTTLFTANGCVRLATEDRQLIAVPFQSQSATMQLLIRLQRARVGALQYSAGWPWHAAEDIRQAPDPNK